MIKPARHDHQQLVSCEVCLKSIPVAESQSTETEDYVAYFCGLDCYELWKNQHPGETMSESSQDDKSQK